MNCPFYHEGDYDEQGLWSHLNAWPCAQYEKAGEDYRAFRADLAVAAAKKDKEPRP